MKWLRLLIPALLGLMNAALAICPYSKYDTLDSILVGDENCKNASVCSVNNLCAATYFTSTSLNSFYGITALGNLNRYSYSSLELVNSTRIKLNDMELNSYPTSITFTGCSNVDISGAKATSWIPVSTLNFQSVSDLNLNNAVSWPPRLKTLSLKDTKTNITSIPRGIPRTLTSFSMEDNNLVDINNLPDTSLTYLYLPYNNINTITRKNWKNMETLNLGNNPLETLAFVQFSSAISSINCWNCNLKNITVDAYTAEYLKALKISSEKSLYGFSINKNVSANAVQCSALGGQVEELIRGPTTLLQGKVNVSIKACVLGKDFSLASSQASSSSSSKNSASSKSAAETTNSSKSDTLVVVICVVIGIFLLFALIFFLYRRSQKRKRELLLLQANSYISQSSPLNTTDEPTQPREDFDESADSSLQRNLRQSPLVDANPIELDVTHLRQHRLELSDLCVTSNAPLASGAFGEVFLGAYGGQKVAIKRLKSKDPHQVQLFINEIILWSRLDCDYIVKFIGASWTKPIEIECVVEYMDLGDLRHFLATNTPNQFTWDQKYQAIMSIVRGLIYLHTYPIPIIHRDLKSRNVLLDSNKGTKLTDFGTSRAAEVDETMTNGIGTFQWMAPEVITGRQYSCPADVYSFGIILSEFCTHQVPYANMRNPQSGQPLQQHFILNKVCAGELYPSFEGVNVPIWVNEVAKKCLCLNPSERPTALTLHALLNKFKP